MQKTVAFDHFLRMSQMDAQPDEYLSGQYEASEDVQREKQSNVMCQAEMFDERVFRYSIVTLILSILSFVILLNLAPGDRPRRARQRRVRHHPPARSHAPARLSTEAPLETQSL
ncbi:TPA: hypothetical protein ACYLN4_008581 [Burkholderia lata]